MNKTISEQYNQIGNDYIVGQSSFFSGVKDEAFEYIKRNVQPIKGTLLLDLGCGHGNDITKYEKLSPEKIFGIDSSELMIKKAKLEVMHPENLFVANMEETGFKNDYFDIITSRYALHYLDSFENVYTEINRILKPGGRYSFVVPHPFRDLTMQKIKYMAKKKCFQLGYMMDKL